jgi:YfiH family protein
MKKNKKRDMCMAEMFIQKDEKLLLIEEWSKENPNLVAGFTTKRGGVSQKPYQSLNTGFHVGDEKDDVIENRKRIAKGLRFHTNSWVGCEQTHDIQIKKIDSTQKGLGALDYETALKGVDGLYTTEKGILLTLCFADCVPLYFYHPKSKLIGIAHAGWKGTVNGIAQKMIHKWEEEGVPPEEVQTIIGPSICGNCYIVDNKVIDLVQNRVEENEEKPYNLVSEGQYKLDLKLLNAQILKKAGVRHVSVTSLCTSCDHDLFFSHRRDKGTTGRLMSFIGWKED